MIRSKDSPHAVGFVQLQRAGCSTIGPVAGIGKGLGCPIKGTCPGRCREDAKDSGGGGGGWGGERPRAAFSARRTVSRDGTAQAWETRARVDSPPPPPPPPNMVELSSVLP